MRRVFALATAFCLVAAGCALAADQAAASTPLPLPAPASFQIRNRQFKELLRPKEANNATGTPLVLYPAEPWKCMTWKVTRASESTFRLQNHFTSKTFGTETHTKDASGAETVVQMPFEKDKPGRDWAIARLPDGTFKITEPQSGKALTARKSENGSGVQIVLEAFSGAEAQKWELEQIDPKTLIL